MPKPFPVRTVRAMSGTRSSGSIFSVSRMWVPETVALAVYFSPLRSSMPTTFDPSSRKRLTGALT